MNSTTSQHETITGAERLCGVEAWLLLAAPDVARARQEWDEQGDTVLKCGVLFTAIRLPGDLVQAAAGTTDPAGIDAFLIKALDGGPVCTGAGLTYYYALVEGGACYEWRAAGTECLPRRTYLGVPAVQLTQYQPGAAYWPSPMDSPGDLCALDKVQALVALGQDRLLQDGPLTWTADS
ncbi:hypothetical protein ACGFZQ_27595 [Streptomyces sp. NPDC048254]|uniref:hypothetical protein n=1 Tax=Streptomyces sp. NPDC048254 TaxID=3365525 RepID=UPI003715A140